MYPEKALRQYGKVNTTIKKAGGPLIVGIGNVVVEPDLNKGPSEKRTQCYFFTPRTCFKVPKIDFPMENL